MTQTTEGESIGLSEKQSIPSQQLNDHFFSQETAPAFITTKGYTTTSAEKERIASYIREVFGKDGEKMIAIAICESGLNPEAINWKDMDITGVGPSQGIFQLNMPYNEALFDWKTNVDIAYKDFYLKRGIKPWSCSRILKLL